MIIKVHVLFHEYSWAFFVCSLLKFWIEQGVGAQGPGTGKFDCRTWTEHLCDFQTIHVSK